MPTKRLYLLRHAKSSWEDGRVPDHDRPLSPRGHRAAALLAEHLRGAEIRPEYVLCSSARRTRETLEGVLGDAGALIEPALYTAGCGQLLARLRQVPDAVGSVMVIGHNPAMQILVLELAGRTAGHRSPAGPESPLEQIARKLPTGALVTLELDGRWSELTPAASRLVEYVRPKALT